MPPPADETVDLASQKTAEARRWREFAERLAPLRRMLADEFSRRALQQSLVPLAVYDRRDGPALVLAIPPGAEHPQLLAADGPHLETVLDFARRDEPGPERLIGDLVVTPAGDTVFYTIDVDGSDQHLVRSCSLAQPDQAQTLAQGAGPSLAWDAASGRVLFTRLDDALCPSAVCLLDPGGGPAQHVYTAESDTEFVDVRTSSDGGTALVIAGTHSSCRNWRLGAGGQLLPFGPTRPDGQLLADCWAGHAAAIWSAAGSPDQLWATADPPGADGAHRDWCCVYEAANGACLEDLVCADGYALAIERADGGQRLLRIGLSGRRAEPVEFALPGARQAAAVASVEIVPGLRQRGVADVRWGSWREPAGWFRVSPDGRVARPVLGHAQDGSASPAADQEVISRKVPSRGGAAVPLTLLRPAGRAGPLPTVLFAYGAYGAPLDPEYSRFRQSLLDRGVAFAVAHVRGGGDLGTAWHEAGRGLRKPDAVADYLAVARYLVDEGWTPPGMIIGRARSAGAVVVGAAVNQAPETFRVAILETPFLDCLRVLMDPDAALTGPEWDEWGNPREDPAVHAMLAGLSPLANVRPGRYPAVILTVGENDMRVQLSEPLRFASAIRAVTTSARDVLVRIDGTGHLGHSSVTADSHDEAGVLAFVLDQLGLADLGTAADQDSRR